MRFKLVLAAACLCCHMAIAAPGGAQTKTDDRVAAESLFSAGRDLMQAGKYAEACEKFEASRRLEAALGTSLNLANCYERLGRTASAWVEFKSAAAEAQRAGDAQRRSAALERAAQLEPKLSRLWLQTNDPKVSVLRNGEPVDAGVLGNAVPVDPGAHQIEARAPGKVTWTQTVDVKGEGATIEIRIPTLADLEPIAAPSAEPVTAPPPPMTSDSGGAQRTWAWVTGGVGVAGVVAGTVFGLLASSNWSKAKKSCADPPYGCTDTQRGETADAQATIATMSFVVGGVGLGLSTVLFLTESGDPEDVEVALEPTRVVLKGRF